VKRFRIRRPTRDEGSLLLMTAALGAIGAGLWLCVGLGVALVAVGAVLGALAVRLGVS